jgi:hypothetical protein
MVLCEICGLRPWYNIEVRIVIKERNKAFLNVMMVDDISATSNEQLPRCW